MKILLAIDNWELDEAKLFQNKENHKIVGFFLHLFTILLITKITGHY
jgi:hypothetical protein